MSVISSQHPELGDLKRPFKSGRPYSLAEISPGLAADFKAAGSAAKLLAAGEAAKRLGGVSDESCGLDFPRIRSRPEEADLAEAYEFKDGRLIFKKTGN